MIQKIKIIYWFHKMIACSIKQNLDSWLEAILVSPSDKSAAQNSDDS